MTPQSSITKKLESSGRQKFSFYYEQKELVYYSMWTLNLGLTTCVWKLQSKRVVSEQFNDFWVICWIFCLLVCLMMSPMLSVGERPVQDLKSSYSLRFGFLLKYAWSSLASVHTGQPIQMITCILILKKTSFWKCLFNCIYLVLGFFFFTSYKLKNVN